MAPTNPYGLDPAVAPYLQPQLNLIQTQEDAQRKALSDFTSAILSQLAQFGPQVGADYNQAIQQSQALAQAGSDSLARANGNDAIQNLLGAINAPASQRAQVAGNLSNVFNGGAAALFGSEGVAPGQQLIGDKAAAQAFTNQLPGINALAGTAALKNLLYQSGLQRQQVLAQVPTIEGQLASQKLDAQKAAADAAYKKQYLGYLGNTLGVKAAQTKASIDQGNTRLGIAQQNADTAAKRAADAAAAAAARIKISQQNANTAAKKASRPAVKPPTAGQLSTLVDQFYSGKTTSKKVQDTNKYKGKAFDYNGNPVYKTVQVKSGQLSYQQAFKRLTALRVPKPQAIDLLNTKYQRGERGRPWLGLFERQALQQAGAKPSALYYKKLPYLNAAQVQALTAANLLPAGELKLGRYFIAPSY